MVDDTYVDIMGLTVAHAEADNINNKNPDNYENTGRYEPAETNLNQGISINPITISKNDAEIINDTTTPINDLDTMINDGAAHEDKRTAAKKAKHLRVDDTNTA